MSIITRLKAIYHHSWFPRFFYRKFDGGADSGVTGYFLLEHKMSFSIGLLHFRNGSRPSYHSHAFNALSWFLTGKITEQKLRRKDHHFAPSLLPKYTPRENIHRVISHGDTWCLTLRGPWTPTWIEYRPDTDEFVKLTHGRKVVQQWRES